MTTTLSTTKTTIENFKSGRGVTLGLAKRLVLKHISQKETHVPKIQPKLLCTTRFELPSVNPHYHGRPCRYVYCNTDCEERQFSGRCGEARPGNGGGETVEAGRGGLRRSRCSSQTRTGGLKTAGGLLVMTLDARRDESMLLVLDARSMREISRAKLGFGQGHGFSRFCY